MAELKNAVQSAVVAGVLEAIKNPETSAAMRDRPAPMSRLPSPFLV